MPVFVLKPVENLGKSSSKAVDKSVGLMQNLRLILLITTYFLWVTLLVLGVKLVQTCGKLG